MHTRTVTDFRRASRSAFLLALLLAAGSSLPVSPSRAQALWYLSIPPDSLLHWQPPTEAALRSRFDRVAIPTTRLPAFARPTTTGPSSADSASWFELGAPVRSGHAFVLDRRRHRFLLAGGEGVQGGSNDLSPQHSVWSYDPASHAWEWLERGPEWLGPYTTTVGAEYDSLRDRLLVLTLRSGEFSLDALELGGTPQWSHLATLSGLGTIYTRTAAGTIDSQRDLYVFLVPHGSGSLLVRVPLGDPPAWDSLSVAGSGGLDYGVGSAVYDGPRDRYVFSLGARLASLDAVAPATLEHIVLPDQEYQLRRLALDREADRLLVVDDGEVSWAIPLGGGTPLRLDNLQSWGGSEAYGHAVAFDPSSRRLFLSGGGRYVARNPLLASMTVDSGSVWVERTPNTGGAAILEEPPPGLGSRYMHSSWFDPLTDRLVVAGGAPYGRYRDFAMAMDVIGGPWRPVGSNSAVRPAEAYGHSMTVDTERQELYVFGGQLNDGTGLCTDALWVTSLAEGGGWELVHPSGAGPTPRRFATFFPDLPRNRLILMGGDDAHVAFLDAWELQLGPTPAWRRLVVADDLFLPYGAVFHDDLRREDWCFSNRTALRIEIGPDTLRTLEQFEVFPDVSTWSNTYDFVGFDFRSRRLLLVDAVRWEGISSFQRAWWVSLDAGHAWTEAPVQVPGPHRRGYFGANFDPTRQRLYVTGGYDDDITYYADTWYLQMPSDVPTPVAASVRFAESDARGVRLSWLVSGASGERAAVQRSADGVAWSAAGEGAWLGSDDVSWDGPPLGTGERAAFRLVLSSAAGETRTPAVWLSGPSAGGAVALAPLHGPPGADLAVSLSLRAGAPARLRVLDAAGRLVAEARPPVGAGVWSFGRAPAPGLYFAVLEQAGERRTAKLVAIR